MFPRRKRLPRAVFGAALSHGKRMSSAHFSAVVTDKESGYAVIVSKKVARLSVTRHRLKRRILSILRELSLPTGLIVYPRSSADGVSYEDMKAELSMLIEHKR